MKKLSEQLKQFNQHSEFHQFDTFNKACSELKNLILQQLQQNIEINGTASMIIPGGSTPLQLFDLLSESNIAWNKVNVCLSDERWVDVSHPDSNERMIKQHLMTNKATGIHFISLKTSHRNPQQAIETCEKHFLKLSVPIDIVILGMGTDGHTASLFPEADNIATVISAKNPHYFTTSVPNQAPHPRISLTYRALIQSKLIILLLKGQGKINTLQQAFMDEPISQMPIRAFIKQQQVPLFVYCSPE